MCVELGICFCQVDAIEEVMWSRVLFQDKKRSQNSRESSRGRWKCKRSRIDEEGMAVILLDTSDGRNLLSHSGFHKLSLHD